MRAAAIGRCRSGQHDNTARLSLPPGRARATGEAGKCKRQTFSAAQAGQGYQLLVDTLRRSWPGQVRQPIAAPQVQLVTRARVGNLWARRAVMCTDGA